MIRWLMDWAVPDSAFRPTLWETLRRQAEDLMLGWSHLAAVADRMHSVSIGAERQQLSDSFVYARHQVDHADRWVQ